MIYVLFSHSGYRIIDAEKNRRHNAQNGRALLRLKINRTIKDYGLSDVMFTNHPNGDMSFVEDDIFEIEDTEKIIDYIFTKMMVDWWKR